MPPPTILGHAHGAEHDHGVHEKHEEDPSALGGGEERDERDARGELEKTENRLRRHLKRCALSFSPVLHTCSSGLLVQVEGDETQGGGRDGTEHGEEEQDVEARASGADNVWGRTRHADVRLEGGGGEDEKHRVHELHAAEVHLRLALAQIVGAQRAPGGERGAQLAHGAHRAPAFRTIFLKSSFVKPKTPTVCFSPSLATSSLVGMG